MPASLPTMAENPWTDGHESIGVPEITATFAPAPAVDFELPERERRRRARPGAIILGVVVALVILTIGARIVGYAVGESSRHTSSSGTATSGPPDLATEVLSILPGLVESPPGNTNGPLTSSNIGLFTTGSRAAAMEQQISDGNMTGYIRTWTTEPPDGNGIVIVAFGLADPTQTGPFLAGANDGLRQGGGTEEVVPGLSGATGFRYEVTTPEVSASEYLITFARGGTVFCVESVSHAGIASGAEAISVATKQAESASGTVQPPVTPPPPASYVLGEVIGYIIVASILIGSITYLVRKRRSRRSMPEPWTGTPTPEHSPLFQSRAWLRAGTRSEVTLKSRSTGMDECGLLVSCGTERPG